MNILLRTPPPPNFRPAGEVTFAEFAKEPPSFTRAHQRKARGSRAAGLSYEKKARQLLQELHGENCLVGPWLRFTSRQNVGLKYCQPDAVVIEKDLLRATVFEIKLKHTSDAWWQVRQLYIPVLRALLPPSFTFVAVELVKWFDGHTCFPEAFKYLDALDAKRLSGLETECFHVHIWNGKG
jgi:hypothetical protein